MTFPFRACVFNAFPVLVLPDVVWRVAVVVRGGRDCRAVSAPHSPRGPHTSTVSIQTFFFFLSLCG